MKPVIVLGLACVLCACSSQVSDVTIPEGATVQDLYIVDCLLPGQVRQLGNTTYMTPRRPTRTTAVDCRIRGGEYVAYDRADYKTALKVWLPAAEAGDAAAQNSVGEIFERGLGSEPNYVVAAHWYNLAAAQGHKSAQFNLGTLYEQGLGVPQDKLLALNWYRAAWGLADDSLMYRSAAERAANLQEDDYIDRLREQKISMTAQQTLAVSEVKAQAEKEAQALRDSSAAQASRDASVAAAAASSNPDLEERMSTPEMISDAGKNFGRYYALVIGNGDYRYLEDLPTPISDVQKISQVLTSQYGFRVRVLTDGDDISVLQAMNQLNDQLTEDDNLLIFYSGHGNRRKSGSYESGYWLPVNAQPPPNDTYWVPTEQITAHLARLKAKRILVIVDSSFAGLLANNPGFLLVSGRDKLVSEAYIKLRFPNKSRLLLASGNDVPLASAATADSSVFSYAFISALENNDAVLTAPALFLNMLDQLETSQPTLDPQFKAIKRAGDEVGDFFFVAR